MCVFLSTVSRSCSAVWEMESILGNLPLAGHTMSFFWKVRQTFPWYVVPLGGWTLKTVKLHQRSLSHPSFCCIISHCFCSFVSLYLTLYAINFALKIIFLCLTALLYPLHQNITYYCMHNIIIFDTLVGTFVIFTTYYTMLFFLKMSTHYTKSFWGIFIFMSSLCRFLTYYSMSFICTFFNKLYFVFLSENLRLLYHVFFLHIYYTLYYVVFSDTFDILYYVDVLHK